MSKEENNSDPSKYLFGVFYYNKDDKRLLPPKRYPFLGWTINFANPYSIILVLSIIIILVFFTHFLT
jgi:uncharacterized membrane protein